MNNFNCIPPNFNLSGSQYSDSGYNSVLILAFYEYQSDCPITYEDYIDRIQFLVLNLFVSNENFDPTKIEDPISTVINEDYDHYFTPKLHNRFSLNVQKNTYEIDSGGLFSKK